MNESVHCFTQDREKYYRVKLGPHPSRAQKLRASLFSFELHCVAAFRFDQATKRLIKKSLVVGFVPRILSKAFTAVIHLCHHVYIEPFAQIGPGLFIAHASCIMIGGKIGKNCTVLHNVTIGWGMAEGEGEAALPEIGDNAWIGTGAILSGKITIGDDVTISSGTVLSKSIPGKCLVAGNPGRVIQQDFENPDQKKYMP
jgi:serine O-acetyltransferase